MKKIIAAILSALVGMFGYTIVDSAVEDRIARLETEIVELRDALEKISESGTETELPEIGDSIGINPDSFDKFLLRENAEGVLEFLHPSEIDKVEDDDVFVYLTEATCQVTGFIDYNYTIGVGRDYEPDSLAFKIPVFSASFKGYTSPALSGKQLSFSAGLGSVYSGGVTSVSPLVVFESTNCTVSSDGSFSFNTGYSLSEPTTNEPDLLTSTIYYQYGKEYAETYLSSILWVVAATGFGVYGLTVS